MSPPSSGNAAIATTIPSVATNTRFFDFARMPAKMTSSAKNPVRDAVSTSVYRQSGVKHQNASRFSHDSPAVKYRNGMTVQMMNASPLGFTTSLGAPDNLSKNSQSPMVANSPQ